LTDTDKQNSTVSKIHGLNTTQKTQTTQNTKLPWFISYDNRPGNDTGLFYNAAAPEPTWQHLRS